MASAPSALEMRFTANMRDLERELQRLQRINTRAAQNLADAHRRAAQQAQSAWGRFDPTAALRGQMGSMGATLRQFAGVIAAAFAGREALAAAESWAKFTNSLKVAGLAGVNLKSVQEALYQSAVKNGVALEPLGQLYSRLSQSQNELGANQKQMIQFTNGITAALRVQGGDASQASGALMQLSQALAGGIVRAEEFNSINEGARPILEAVAAGWSKAGMTVSKLRAVMIDGKLTSKEFFDAFLAGSAMLEEKAAKAPLTVGASMTVLHTALTKYIGETDQAYGVTERISGAIRWMGDNLDLVRDALLGVGGVFMATLLPALARTGAVFVTAAAGAIASTAAMVANTASAFANASALGRLGMMANGAALAQRGLAAAMGFFGGPVGLAIMGIAAAVAYLGVTSATAALETEALNRRIAANAAELESANVAATKKRAETGTLTAAEYQAAVQTASLTGEVHKLKDAYYLAAAAAKALAVAQAWQKQKAAVADQNQARRAYDARVEDERAKARSARNRGSGEFRGLYNDVPLSAEQDMQIRNRVLNHTDEGKTFKKSVDVAVGMTNEARETEQYELKNYGATKLSPAAGKDKKTKKSRSSGDIASASEAAIDAAEKEYHAALHASAKTAAERHKYALEVLDEEKAEKLARIEKQVKDKDITAAAGEAAKGFIEQAHTQSVLNENYRREEELSEQKNQLLQAQNDLDVQSLRSDADALEGMAQNARSLRERYKYERLALTKRQEADDLAFKVEQDQLALVREKLGWTQQDVQNLRDRAQANRNKQKANENADQDQRQSSRSGSFSDGLREHAESFGSLNEQLSNIAGQGINNLTRGLADAVMGAKSLKEAFSDMAKSIISSLIEMAIRFAIFEAIGMAFGVPGLGKAAIGIGKNAKGTNNWRGGLTMVGEKGPELAYLPGGTQIMPNNVLNAAAAASMGTGRAVGGQSVTINTTVNANDAVLTDWVRNEIAQGNMRAVDAAKRMTIQDILKRNRHALGR